MPNKVTKAQIVDILASFYNHSTVSKPLKPKLNWEPWTGSHLSRKKVKFNIPKNELKTKNVHLKAHTTKMPISQILFVPGQD